MKLFQVREIFASIQGEGPFSGRPAVFVRFAGCNLQCPFCDTDHDSEIRRMTEEALFEAIMEEANLMDYPIGLVVFTGGEPMLQPFGPVVKRLTRDPKNRMDVQVETNGTICPEDFPFDKVTIVCSPKPNSEVHGVMRQMTTAWKFLVEQPLDPPALAFEIRRREIVYLQPMDQQEPERNRANMRWAASLCMRHGFRLSLQIHKVLGFP